MTHNIERDKKKTEITVGAVESRSRNWPEVECNLQILSLRGKRGQSDGEIWEGLLRFVPWCLLANLALGRMSQENQKFSLGTSESEANISYKAKDKEGRRRKTLHQNSQILCSTTPRF